MRLNTSNTNTNMQVKWHHPHAIRRLWMFGTRKRGICSALLEGLFFSQRTQNDVLPANDIGDIHLDLCYSKCHPWNIVDPQDPHTASMNFYCSNHIFVVCETRFLHILQPNQHITAGLTWKYI